jgi:hypothetical protein
MSAHTVDTVARHAAAAITRRHSLLTLGGAALAAAVARPTFSEAKKKVRKDCQKKEKQRCGKDTAACLNTVAVVCGTPDCVALQACCATCSANGFLACFLAAL